MPTLRLHDLRVTFARRLASRGVDLATIQELLGHATIVMTRRYVPSNLQLKRDAVARLAKQAGAAGAAPSTTQPA